jgi:hypothetical protein
MDYLSFGVGLLIESADVALVPIVLYITCMYDD